MSFARTMPGLTAPFAVIGLVAGWLSAGLLANPLVGVAYGGKQLYAALAACGVCALVGAALTRAIAARLPRGASVWAWLRLAPLLLLGGMVSGAVVGRMTGFSMYGAVTGGVAGLAVAAAFLPVCGLVLAAVQRATRARFGSIVAGSDRRAVWQLVAASLAVATLAALPDWPAASIDDARAPAVAAAFSFFASVGAAALAVADAGALRRVRFEAARATEQGVAGDLDVAVPSIDLGLGDDVLASVEGRSAYRSSGRAAALVIGSPDEACAALRWSLVRGGVCVAACVATLAAHAYATSDGARLAYLEARCERGSSRHCGEAAAELEVGPDADIPRAGALHVAACNGGHAASCERLRALLASKQLTSPDHATELTHVFCAGKTSPACKALSSPRLRGPGAPGAGPPIDMLR